MFVTDGIIMFPTTKAGLSYAFTELIQEQSRNYLLGNTSSNYSNFVSNASKFIEI